MSPAEYREALTRKLKDIQGERSATLGGSATGATAADSYMAWLEAQGGGKK